MSPWLRPPHERARPLTQSPRARSARRKVRQASAKTRAPKAVQMRIACGSPAAARTGAHRRPCAAPAAFAGGARVARIWVRIPSGSMATTWAPSTADTPTAVAAIWPNRRARRGPAAKNRPIATITPKPVPASPAAKQGRIERQPMGMAPESGDVGDRRQQQRDRCDGPDRNRQSTGGEQRVSIDGRGEDQLEVRPPEQRAGEVRDRLAHDPWQDERGAAGENRRDPRNAVGTLFDLDEPAGDRVGRDVERHEHERNQSRQSAQRQRAEHRREATRAQAQIVQDETRKSGQRPNNRRIMRRVRSERSDRGTKSPASPGPRQCSGATRRASPRRSSAHAR